MKKFIPLIVLVAIVIAAASFFGGMQYANAKGPQSGRGDFQNGSGLQNRSFANGDKQMEARNNMAMGEILSKDDQSLTIKLTNGGSKIVFFSSSTEIGKEVSASIQDLEVGKAVTASGAANDDGSIVAKTIQLRDSLPLMNGQGPVPETQR
ncbi:MAG: hypothetical protein BWY53_00570 [Parcubacteria group bacterium ADurb.Bin326]|nr:MAG: hypothetical protein BWY53_00570 [Parcubacteria group bacterium ADurb.Bin326]